MTSLEEAFQKAAGIAKEMPENLQQVAFEKALEEILGGPRSTRSRSAADSRTAARPDESVKVDIVDRFLDEVDRSEYPEVVRAPKHLPRALRVLQVSEEVFGVQGLKASQIATILEEKFRVPAKPNAIQMALESDGTLCNRKKEGAAFVYNLTAYGEEYLTNWLKNENDGPATKAPTKPRPQKKRPPKPGAAGKSDEKVAKRKNGGRPGPKAFLEALLDVGFFKERKTPSQVMAYAKDKKGHTYTFADFGPSFTRLLREGKLDREKGEDGQYEYWAI